MAIECNFLDTLLAAILLRAPRCWVRGRGAPLCDGAHVVTAGEILRSCSCPESTEH